MNEETTHDIFNTPTGVRWDFRPSQTGGQDDTFEQITDPNLFLSDAEKEQIAGEIQREKDVQQAQYRDWVHTEAKQRNHDAQNYAPDMWAVESAVDEWDSDDDDYPTVLQKSDGSGGLFYAGESNSLHGTYGNGKSLLAAAAAVEVMAAGGMVLWLDYEMKKSTVVRRIRDMEVNGEQIDRETFARCFRYKKPVGGAVSRDPNWDQVINTPWSLIIIDSTNQSLETTVADGNPSDNAAVNKWDREFRQPLVATGACVISIDHVNNDDAAGKRAGGAQAKMSTLGGAGLRLKPANSGVLPGKGTKATLEFHIGKDRHGGIQPSVKGLAATAIVDSTHEDGITRITIESSQARADERAAIYAKRMGSLEEWLLGQYDDIHNKVRDYANVDTLNAEALAVNPEWGRRQVTKARQDLIQRGDLAKSPNGTIGRAVPLDEFEVIEGVA